MNFNCRTSQDITFKLLSHKGHIESNSGDHRNIPVQEKTIGTLVIKIDKKDLNSSKERLKMGLYSEGKLIETFKVNFQGPVIIK